MAVTALALGLKPNPEISLHDGIIVVYLLYNSWVTVFFSLPATPSRAGADFQTLYFVSVVQSYIVLAFALALLANANTFGSTPACNPNARVVLIRPFNALKAGRPVCWVLTIAVVALYTALLFRDHTWKPSRIVFRRIMHNFSTQDPKRSAESIPSPPTPPANNPSPSTGRYDFQVQEPRSRYRANVDWTLVIKLVVVSILWSLSVMNTELLIRWNAFAPSDSSQSPWQFGQVLPMFLVLLPLISLVNVFRELGLRRLPVSNECKG